MFSSEIDFRTHQAAQHSKTRAEARQYGTIPVEFQSPSLRDRKQHDPAHRGNTIVFFILYISENCLYLFIYFDFIGTFKSGEFRTQGTNNQARNER